VSRCPVCLVLVQPSDAVRILSCFNVESETVFSVVSDVDENMFSLVGVSDDDQEVCSCYRGAVRVYGNVDVSVVLVQSVT
jgi:hypothetical protein